MGMVLIWAACPFDSIPQRPSYSYLTRDAYFFAGSCFLHEILDFCGEWQTFPQLPSFAPSTWREIYQALFWKPMLGVSYRDSRCILDDDLISASWHSSGMYQGKRLDWDILFTSCIDLLEHINEISILVVPILPIFLPQTLRGCFALPWVSFLEAQRRNKIAYFEKK